MSIIRKTKTVKLIVDEFNINDKALGATQLVEKFNKVMDKTTVYRILDRLENSNIIHSFIDYDGFKKYAKGRKNNLSKKIINTHPHFQCEDCGISSCLPVKITIPSIPNYIINSAEHILTGQCKNCSSLI
tara:strand:- start:292 stop:681 length:390 start_codon:yes stop_codon:yes gene_type:complete